jgi:hypothetical protein
MFVCSSLGRNRLCSGEMAGLWLSTPPLSRQACSVVFKRPIVLLPVCRKTCYWIRMCRTEQTRQLEAIQKRAMKITFGSNSGDLPRPLVTVPSLAERRKLLTKRFFMDLLNEKTVCTKYFRQNARATSLARSGTRNSIHCPGLELNDLEGRLLCMHSTIFNSHIVGDVLMLNIYRVYINMYTCILINLVYNK